ncbi:efflux RND transporter periplasmic adaptor subunit [Chitinivorax sp. PXF-14]|uniref:efflux RND transporter periplasmic adaptor subunit n=1 Tax=Chitinivorax sp. PXF-14 TaxID=3230488 RepID=UPI00346670CC
MNNDLSSLKIDRTASPHPQQRKRRYGRWAALAVAVAAGSAFVLTAAQRPQTVQTVSVTNAYPSQALTVINATGYVVAQRKASIASKATGRLEWLGVREGSKVKAGELIARLENADLKANVAQAAANVDVARANLLQAQAELQDATRAWQRSLDLQKQNFISTAEVDQVKARLDRAKAAVEAQRSAINAAQAATQATRVAVENTEIRAPFDGVVLTKNANVGDVVAPFSSSADAKAAVVTMADMGTLEVEADVSEASVGKVKIGMPCEIQLDALPDMRLKGVVASQVPSVDRAKATIMFKIRFVDKDERVLPEMSAKVAFLERELKPEERQPKVAVAPSAVARVDGKPVLWLMAEGKARRIDITLGEKLGDLQTLRGAIKVGDKVINNPTDKLKDGTTVQLEQK